METCTKSVVTSMDNKTCQIKRNERFNIHIIEFLHENTRLRDN